MNAKLVKVGLMFAVAALAACGGGGGDTPAGGVAPSPSPAPAPVPVSSNLVTTISPSTYAAGSAEKAIYDYLNAERVRDGFGAVAQSAPADVAAQGHADWQISNNFLTHFQTSGTPGFTGFNVNDRLVSAGYAPVGQLSGAEDEISNLDLVTDKVLYGGLPAVKGLLNAPFHMRGLLSGARDIGISVRNAADVSSVHGNRVLSQINLAYLTSAGPQLVGSTDVSVYPCNGATGVERELRGEEPNPVLGRDLAVNPLGRTMFIQVREGNTLSITSSSMTKVSTGVSVVLRSAVAFQSHNAYVVSDNPIDAMTQYQFVVNGTNNGTPFTRTCLFTTGS